jgi:hypothetical protein
VEFRVETLDYGRHGAVVKEPRTGLMGQGATEEAAIEDLKSQLLLWMKNDVVPDEEGPRRSIRTITV